MPVEIKISNTKFFRQLINDEDYTDNPSEFTPNLTGNGLLRVKVTQTIDIEWFSLATAGNPMELNISPLYLEKASGSFLTDDFSVGDVFDFNFF